MTIQELRKELQLKRAESAKMRLGLAMQSEKNSGLYRAHKRDISRMAMVLVELEKNQKSPVTEKTTSVPASSVSSKTSKKASQTVKKSVKDIGSKKKKSS